MYIYIYIGSRPEVPRKGILGESRYWWYTWGEVGWGGVGCWRSLRDVHAVDATLPMGWGGVGCCRSLQDVHAVDATLPMGWGGVGWGGMLPFAARCTRCGCYVANGVGWGGVGCWRSLQDVHAVDATLPMGSWSQPKRSRRLCGRSREQKWAAVFAASLTLYYECKNTCHVTIIHSIVYLHTVEAHYMDLCSHTKYVQQILNSQCANSARNASQTTTF